MQLFSQQHKPAQYRSILKKVTIAGRRVMTAYELLDLLATWKANAAFAEMSLLSVFTAYLLVAYFVGRDLPRPQVVIITCLMLWFSFAIIAAMHSSLQTLIDIRILGSVGYSVVKQAIFFKWVLTLGCSVGPFLCIKFMFHMRHPRVEGPPMAMPDH
jgi:hypothetical protein